MEDWTGLVNLEGKKEGNMYDRAEGLGQYRHLAKFSVAILILFVLLTMIGDSDCLANGFDPINLVGSLFGLLSSNYAAYVVGVNICTPGNGNCDTTNAIGPPDKKSVSLGGGHGCIIATMSKSFTDGPGADIRVYEVGDREKFSVFISTDSANWILVAEKVRRSSGDISASIDIFPHRDEYRYIKIVNESSSGGRTPGSDIDAIETMHPQEGGSRSSVVLPILVLLIVVIAIVVVIQ